MEMSEVREKLKSEQYDFLRKDVHLGNNIILLVLGGSIASGTNDEDSDIDIRGITLDIAQDVIGRGSVKSNGTVKRFEQYVEPVTDTVIYSLSKFIELALAGNPNIFEMLGVKEEHIIYINENGRMLMNHRKCFYSKRVVHTFAGFADSQLRKLENALARDRISQSRKEEHIKNSVERFLYSASSMFQKYDKEETFALSISDSDKTGYDKELYIDIHLERYPLRDFNGIIREMTAIVRDYDKNHLNHRNNKKSDRKLNKHAMQLVKYYLMGTELVETGDFSTYREKEHELLMKIKNGEYMLPDGSYDNTFSKMIDELRDNFNAAVKKTKLPDYPDYERMETIKMQVLMMSLLENRKEQLWN